MSDITVVVASRNRRHQLLETIPRHLALPEHPRVVVVDDASTDGSGMAVEAAHPQVRVIGLRRQAGCAARNRGIAEATTPYVALTDDDAWWRPGALRVAAELLDRHPRLAAVNPRILVGHDEREDPLCAEMASSPLRAAPGQPGHPLLSFIACAVVVRRDAILGAGGFSDRFQIGAEEELLAWDLAAKGWQMSYIPEITAHHCPPRGAGSRPERRELIVRNTLWTQWLRRPARTAAWRTAQELRRLPADRVSARAVIRALAGVPWVVRERRLSPPHVEAMRRLLDDQQLRSASRAPT
jgi:GT2 family glycosyltransferase